MEISEIKRRFYSPNTRFYGRMYGSTSVDDEIIEINKKEIRFAASGDGFIFVWDWPGPDWNFYKFVDYGKSWAFDMRDFYPY